MPQGEYLRKHADPLKICERLNDEIKRITYQCKTDRQKEIAKFLSVAAIQLMNTFYPIPENADHPERNSYFKICADYYNKFLIFSRDNYDETLRNHAWTKFTDSFIRLLPPDKQRFGETYECLDKEWYRQLLTVTASS